MAREAIQDRNRDRWELEPEPDRAWIEENLTNDPDRDFFGLR